MTTRRGFLGAILAAAVAPAIVRAEILMPVRPVIEAPPIITPVRESILGDVHIVARGEISYYDGIRFIESPYLPVSGSVNARTAGAIAPLTLAMVNRAVARMKRHAAPEPYVVFAHPSWAEELRREGIPVQQRTFLPR